MAGREDDLIEQIEHDALDTDVPIATALRKCIALGGKSGSEELRDWATRELKGYGPDEEVPPYRTVAAPLLLDGIAGNYKVSRQRLAPSALPDFAQEYIKEEVQLSEGVGAIEALLEQPQINLSPVMASDLARFMNADSDNPYQHIESIYWGVAHATVSGLLDQVRTSLTQLVAELRASMSGDEAVPSKEAANAAVHLVISGKRHQVQVTTTQATGPGSTATATAAASPEPEESGFWTRGRRIAAFVVGVATIAGAVFGAIQAF